MEFDAPRLFKDFMFPSEVCTDPPIVLTEKVRNYEMKSYQFDMLPSFHGDTCEDPLAFLRDFYKVVHCFPLHGLTEDELKLRYFSYTLRDAADR